MKTDYSTIAPKYDESPLRRKVIDKHLSIFLESMNGPTRVVDVGCGTGHWLTTQIATQSRKNISWYGVDPSLDMLNRARDKSDAIVWINAFVDNLPFEDNFCDYICSHDAYHHFPNKLSAFKELNRVLKEGGSLLLKNHDPYFSSYNVTNHFFPTLRKENLKRFLTLEQMIETLKTAGFRDIKIDRKEYLCNETLTLNDYIDLIKKRTMSDLWLISNQEYERGIEELNLWLSTRQNDLQYLHSTEKTVQVYFSAIK